MGALSRYSQPGLSHAKSRSQSVCVSKWVMGAQVLRLSSTAFPGAEHGARGRAARPQTSGLASYNPVPATELLDMQDTKYIHYLNQSQDSWDPSMQSKWGSFQRPPCALQCLYKHTLVTQICLTKLPRIYHSQTISILN